MNLILISMGVLGVIAFLAACLLYVVSLYFKVEEDPRIDLVTAVLPGANCVLTPAAEGEEAATAADGGKKEGFDPVIAAKIKALPTPRAVFPNVTARVQAK